jgi:predicted CXXCH cytochrome family protein
MRRAERLFARGAIVLVMCWLPSGCERIVYRDADPFAPLPTGAGEFLGYSSIESKRTVCGNCHVGKQAQWQNTAHAGAWSTLAQSGAMQQVCQACHSVSSRGNLVTTESVGWVATQDARYHDVQCESCHGPGLTHVTNPDQVGTKPLATLAVGTDLTRGCGQCHSGTHRPFAEEWSSSNHALVRSVSRATNVNCIGCHEAKGVLQAWGVNSTFMVETGENEHLAITCAVCHDPHDARNPGQLRFPIDVQSVETNLCMKCHQRRSQPALTSSAGPHSPEGPLLLGEAGWFPPNFQFPAGALVGSHGSDRNPRMCATCHVNDYEVRDELTGSFTFRATGHSFQAIPCADATGIPTGARDCDVTARSFRSCTSCHTSEAGARSAFLVAELRIDRLVAEVQGLISRIPATEFSNTDNRYTTGEGARFNMQLAQKKGSIVHNPFLIEALLLASIRQIEIDYGITPSAGLSLQQELTPPR